MLPGPASFTSGNKTLISEFLYSKEFFLETIPIKVIFLFLLACCIIFFNSADSPLLLIRIRTSLELIWPKSPWEHELASTKNEGVPTDESVEDIFFAIIPDLPTPDNIIFPFLQLF